MNSGGKKFFNILMIIVGIIMFILIAYLAYYYISGYIAIKEAEEAVEIFETEVGARENDKIIVEISDENKVQNEIIQEPSPNNTTTSPKTTKYKGYSVIGTIQIPRTNVKIPIVDKVTPSSITASAAMLYGTGLNEIGNTVIVAHNYRNGTFFSNNKKLANGDKIYITDSKGNKIEYEIYNTYITSDTDFEYATRNTNGKREISLSTCTTDASKRLVIWAKEK